MIGVLHHPKIERSYPLADEISAWLNARNHTVWRESVWDGESLTDKMRESSLVIVLGGDGSILRAARAAAPVSVPIFSVNLGRIGFLSEASPTDWPERLQKVLAGEHRLERRLMLQAAIERKGERIANVVAVNEVVVGRGRQARVLRFNLSVDGHPVTSYVADGLIMATPTGSTAYSLAAGGPIMPPELPNFMVVPVAPHLSLDRAIVLYEEATVHLQVEFDHEATVTPDGQEAIPLESGDVILIAKAPVQSLFVRVNDPSYFYNRLTTRSGGLRRD